MFLKLNTFNPNTEKWSNIYINMNLIETINPPSEEGSEFNSVLITSDGYYKVRETPDYIMALIDAQQNGPLEDDEGFDSPLPIVNL